MTQSNRTIAIALLALASGLSAPALAQPPAAPAIPPAAAVSPATLPFNGIAHIAIRVKDIAASVAFYNKLGYMQAFSMNRPDGTITQSFLKINDKQFIELYPINPSNPTQDKPEFLHLCFEGVDLNAIHDSYVAEGLTPISVRKAGAGNLLFTLKGPQQFRDPQNIEYTQYQPGSLHTNDIGKHLGADRVADKMIVVSLAMQDPAAARAYYLDKLGFTASRRVTRCCSTCPAARISRLRSFRSIRSIRSPASPLRPRASPRRNRRSPRRRCPSSRRRRSPARPSSPILTAT